jgi:hypothetical protein
MAQMNGTQKPSVIREIAAEVVDRVKAALPEAVKPVKPSALDAAKAWLKLALAGGQVPSTRIESLAKKEGISARTLRRAAKAAGVVHIRIGRKQWNWALPRQGSIAGQGQ